MDQLLNTPDAKLKDYLNQIGNLERELNDDKLWEEWRKARSGICYYYQNKFFGQGTVKPLMSIACQQRLNSESKRYCITGKINNVVKKTVH